MKILYAVLIALGLCWMANTEKDSESLIREGANHVVSFTLAGQIYGTGFHVTYKGMNLIITNKHVCKAGLHYGKDKGHVNVNGKRSKIIKIWNRHDLCAVETNKKQGLRISRVEPQALDKITLIGHPRGLPLVVREGRIVGDRLVCLNIFDCYLSVQISATAYQGNSGSPVLNEEGRVVGVLFAGSPAYPHEPLTVPYNDLVSFLEELLYDALGKPIHQNSMEDLINQLTDIISKNCKK